VIEQILREKLHISSPINTQKHPKWTKNYCQQANQRKKKNSFFSTFAAQKPCHREQQ